MESLIGFHPPTGWVVGEAPELAVAKNRDVTVDVLNAWRAPEGAGRAVEACVGLDLATWTDEATPVALERLVATTSSVAASLDPTLTLRVSREVRTGTTSEQWLVPTGEADAKPAAKTLLGFTTTGEHPRLDGCLVVCAPTTRDCEDALDGMTFDPLRFVPPPPANALLRGVVLGIHHPETVATTAVALFFALGVVAVWMRPRPRRK